MTDETPAPLDPSKLYRYCDPDEFEFRTTADLEEVEITVGQERALEALDFGVGIGGAEYNIYALGESGAGKLHTVRSVLERHAAQQPPTSDWCYVNNFQQPHKPRALCLPSGKGAALQRDMDHLIEELETAIPAAFESEDYRTRTEEIAQEFEDRREQALEELRHEAEKQNIVLVRTPGGFAFAPKGGPNDVLSPEEFNQLPEEKKHEIQKDVEVLQQRLQKVLRQFPDWRKETRDKIRDLDREIAEFAVGHLIDSLKANYDDLPEIVAFLEAVRADVIANVDAFRPQSESPAALLGIGVGRPDYARYRVNLLVGNGSGQQAPVVHEALPNHGNLLGRSEYRAQMGTLVTDFTMIRPGALHRANGGYLVLEARKVLAEPHAWETLKRALEAGEIRIESLERTWGLMSTATLEPEPIPLDVKVVIVGDRQVYYLLKQHDPDFSKLFKVAADFEDSVDRNRDTHLAYARLVGSIARRYELRPLDREGTARAIEQCARLAQDATKLSTHLGRISDLLREANYWAAEAGHESIGGADIEQARNRQVYRSDRIHRRALENIERGTIMIDTAGAVAGQVNGLVVVELGDYWFGQPTRITATTRMGEGEFVDIERETELGGPIHSKGVMILSNFLAARYAAGVPLSIQASLVFEQSYGEVEGDSASLAELCAILSSISRVPVLQSLAVTGSVNQLGRVQPIGGVNEKIEGFFEVCRRGEGLDGSHGVLIPESNVRHLMLRPDVVKAVGDGQFSVYAVRSVDEALALLTARPAGTPDTAGRFPAESVNGLVDARLREYAETRRRYGNKDEDGNGGGHGGTGNDGT